MKTKEVIIQEHFVKEFGHSGNGEFLDYVLSAMEEYKQQEVDNLYNLAQSYAEFIIGCDRRGMKLIKFEDFVKELAGL